MKRTIIISLCVLSLIILAFALSSCKKEYSVTFNTDGGSVIIPQTVEDGNLATEPKAPTKEGHNFLGWYLNDNEYKFIRPVREDITLTAKWERKTYTVTFNTNGGNSGTQKKVKHGDTVDAYFAYKAKHTLIGWYNGDTQWNFKVDTVTEDITLTAKWEPFPAKVTFDANGGSVGETEREVELGNKIGALPTAHRENYELVGWYLNGELVNHTLVIDKDILLVAKWQGAPKRVTFSADNGTVDEQERIVAYNDEIGNLPIPTREGYIFLGWYSNGELYDKTTIILKDTTLLAIWLYIEPCVDGTNNHAWSPWQEISQATCETPQQNSRTCATCGLTEYKEGKPALGHDWSNWSDEYMSRSRTCYECGKAERINYKNVTIGALGAGVYPKIDGEAWGKDKALNLINGMFEPGNEGTIAGTGIGAVIVTLELTTPISIDMIYVKGRGSASIEVTVTYEDGSEKMIGMGAFGNEPAIFAVEGKVITKVVVKMPNPSVGADYWQEITLAQAYSN